MKGKGKCMQVRATEVTRNEHMDACMQPSCKVEWHGVPTHCIPASVVPGDDVACLAWWIKWRKAVGLMVNNRP